MFDRVEAVGYTAAVPRDSGASEPVLIAVDQNGNEVDVFAKLTDRLPGGPHALVKEAIVSFLARDLELPAPEPFQVVVSEEFIASIKLPGVASRFRQSMKLIYGSKALPPGYGTVTRNITLDSTTREIAAEIYAFDALIGNVDRGGPPPEKANCLTNGRDFAIIDHEKAFFPYESAIGALAILPWQTGGLQYYMTPGSHIFINELRRLRWTPDFNSFVAKWNKVTDARLGEYEAAIPEIWKTNPGGIRKIFSGLRGIRDNIGLCVIEVGRTLSRK